ncbi:MAG: hypothetical protein CVT48_01630 [Thermoplasmata archaeon HGW-Thermoplasmata-1]|nr:MAG: hypothetical protein CVT48_01630 [Thermoplasmata archaeon HGW-Thermoplasmata-1]
MPEKEDIAPHVEELARVLGEKVGRDVTKEELEEQLLKFLDYGVPIDQAKRTLARHYGVNIPQGETASRPIGSRTLLSDVRDGDSKLNLLVRVISVNPKEITVKGEKKTIFYGFLGDESASTGFTAWKDFELEKGDVVRIGNAYARGWQEKIDISLGDYTRIMKVDPSELPRHPAAMNACKVSGLSAGLSGVELATRILSVEGREVTARGEQKTVFSGIMGDETGKVRFTAWHDFGIKEGDVVRISGAYVKDWRGVPQLVFDENSTLEKLDGDALPEADILDEGNVTTLAQLVERKGATDVVVNATLIEVRPGSGLVFRCPECNRVLQKGTCRLHDKVTGTPDLRIKAVLDDGEENISAVFGREITEALLGKSMAECMEEARESMDYEVVESELKARLVGEPMRVRGNAINDDYGVMLLAQEAKRLTVDIISEADKLAQEMI